MAGCRVGVVSMHPNTSDEIASEISRSWETNQSEQNRSLWFDLSAPLT
jgi:hypothetical protein